MTKRGHADLQQELRRLKSEERPEVLRQIEEARAHGDLSENAEYHAARERQALLDARRRQIEDRLARAQVIDPNEHPTDAVRFGMTVVLADVETDDEVTYTLVGEDEADVSHGLISINSPVARALVGKSIDDDVTGRVPKGTRQFQILAIRAE
jgi:transcription elongation factor GreA